jgi:glycerophosphoryl diester phosphodiesterase
MNMLQGLPSPAIIAHRGASACAPENTLAAFKLALHQGADGIELDAKLSRDGQVVVIHDQTVERTTPQQGKVRDLLAAELRKMDAGSHFDVAFQGEPIPTLEEVLKAVGRLTYTNIELTNYGSPFDALPAQVAELVRKQKLGSRVMFSSFSPIALLRIHRLLPDAPLGLLLPPGRSGKVAQALLGRLVPHQSLHPERGSVTPEMVTRAHGKGRKVLVYTVNQESEMRRLFEAGVDGIFTDDPILARRVLSSFSKQAARAGNRSRP